MELERTNLKNEEDIPNLWIGAMEVFLQKTGARTGGGYAWEHTKNKQLPEKERQTIGLSIKQEFPDREWMGSTPFAGTGAIFVAISCISPTT